MCVGVCVLALFGVVYCVQDLTERIRKWNLPSKKSFHVSSLSAVSQFTASTLLLLNLLFLCFSTVLHYFEKVKH
jgi:hypothetical protein